MLCRGYLVPKRRHVLVERLVIEIFEYLAFDEGVQIVKIRDHPRSRVDFSRYANFHDVIMAVAMGIVAFPKDAAILLFAEPRSMQAMRRREEIPAAKIDVASGDDSFSSH